MEGQLEFPKFPKRETRQLQPVLTSPPRQVWSLRIWERDDEPDFVVCTVEATDGNGKRLVLINWATPRDEEFFSALHEIAIRVREAWYETHTPF